MTSVAAKLDRLAPLQKWAASGGVLAGVPQSAAGLVVAWLRASTKRCVVAVTTEPESLFTDIATWTALADVALFPPADTPSFDRIAPSEEVIRRRLATLAMLARGDSPLVVTSPAALLRPTLDPQLLQSGVTELVAGQRTDREELVAHLVNLGYQRVTAVSSPGEFAVRGGILDVFALDRSNPWRAEWFGSEIEEIREFSVESQTSVATLERVFITPARELDFRPERVTAALEAVNALDISGCRPEVRESWERDVENLGVGAYDEGLDVFFPYLCGVTPATLFDHLPQDAIVVVVGGREAVLRQASRHADELGDLFDQEMARAELPKGALRGVLDGAELGAALDRHSSFEIVREASAAAADLGWSGTETFAGRFEAFTAWAATLQRQETIVVVATRQQRRIEELVADSQLVATDVRDFTIDTTLSTAECAVITSDLSGGFVAADLGLAVVTDHELFGAVKRRGSPLARGARSATSTSARGERQAASGKAAAQAFVIQFKPGDLVVHRDHGIARFVEMRTVHDDETGDHEYMTLEYADSDRLFVPVAHLDRVDRYVGGASDNPSLSRLGSGEWENTKRRVKERTEAVARELLGLYSRREASPGHAYTPDGAWQHELEASFPYQETPDQELVLEEIKRDMESSKPMDRVVCGDVGFGKTELAVRAAFKAAAEGRQVAVLVPTTVLAQQHYNTFSERIKPFPLTVAQLSRFCSEEEIKSAIAGIRSGAADIVIGTHRLLQKDVNFRNLGLVIIDEEQRFGVMQKERFKELRLGVDVLSLSATPIPRTLHMSLAGIRDLSVIQSPPEERQPIKTYVTAREDSLIREVITRELARGGQVFYVHNRVQTIEYEAEALRKLVPEARIAVGHGQMDEGLLASVMKRFADGEVDVLVATTIIESGLDIPNANTMVVNDAHRFGLAQLYQLRGRVGRSGNRAYAYMLYPPERSLTEKADKRLDVISELQDLGAGFKLAMRDLEIRGAGNLLGEEQHGEIAAVGLELYNRLLNSAVKALQGKPIAESPAQVTVALPLPTHLPPEYVGDEKLRLRCYQDLAGCTDQRQLDKAAKGLVDRFGPLPSPAEGLLFSLKVRLLAAQAGVLSIETQRGGVVIQLPQNHGFDLAGVALQYRPWVSQSATRLILSDPKAQRLQGGQWQEILQGILGELARLSRQREAVPAGR